MKKYTTLTEDNVSLITSDDDEILDTQLEDEDDLLDDGIDPENPFKSNSVDVQEDDYSDTRSSLSNPTKSVSTTIIPPTVVDPKTINTVAPVFNTTDISNVQPAAKLPWYKKLFSWKQKRYLKQHKRY